MGVKGNTPKQVESGVIQLSSHPRSHSHRLRVGAAVVKAAAVDTVAAGR